MLRRMWQSQFLRHAGVMVGGSQVVNALNLFYHLLVVRMLSVENYGTLNSLVSLTLYFGQITLPFQPALARFIAHCRETGDEVGIRGGIRKSSFLLGVIGLVILLGFIAGSGFLARQQNIAQPGYLIAAGFLVATAILGVIPLAFLQGIQNFSGLASLNIAAAAGKLLIGVGLIWAGAGVVGGLSGYLAGASVLTGSGYWLISSGMGKTPGRRPAGSQLDLAPVYRSYLPTAAFLLSFTLLTNLDVNLVKKFFSAEEAGLYSVAQMVGKIILYLPGGIAVVLFPKAAAAQAGNRASRHLLLKGMACTGAIGAGGVMAAGLFPRLLLQLLTGKSAPESVALVFPFALAMFFFSLAWTAGFYNLSLHRVKFVLPVAGLAVLQAAGICLTCLYRPHLETVVSLLAVGGLATLAVTLGFALAGKEKQT